jgi:hypothetical protein
MYNRYANVQVNETRCKTFSELRTKLLEYFKMLINRITRKSRHIQRDVTKKDSLMR